MSINSFADSPRSNANCLTDGTLPGSDTETVRAKFPERPPLSGSFVRVVATEGHARFQAGGEDMYEWWHRVLSEANDLQINADEQLIIDQLTIWNEIEDLCSVDIEELLELHTVDDEMLFVVRFALFAAINTSTPQVQTPLAVFTVRALLIGLEYLRKVKGRKSLPQAYGDKTRITLASIFAK